MSKPAPDSTAHRQAIQHRAADGLKELDAASTPVRATVGFDGFVDAIIAVVDKRHSPDAYEPIRTIAQFGRKISEAAGMSSNYELVVKREKLGGNGPIMANALACHGHNVTYLGALGHPQVHPVFAELDRRAKCLSVTAPARTDALEFDDGKLMLGKMQSLDDVCWDRFEQMLDADTLRQTFLEAKLISMVNWTMTPHMNDIWRRLTALLADDPRPREARPLVFLDLADPEKRTRDDIAEALALTGGFADVCPTLVGLNFKEANQVAEVLAMGCVTNHTDNQAIIDLACAIRERLGVTAVVIHPRQGAGGARIDADGRVESAWFTGPFVQRPRLSTGAGDNFNAGFCTGWLAGLDLPAALCAGVAASGFYVREARSATLRELADFCRGLPEPE